MWEDRRAVRTREFDSSNGAGLEEESGPEPDTGGLESERLVMGGGEGGRVEG